MDTTVWSTIPRGKPDWQNTMSSDERCYELRDGKLILRGIINENLQKDDSPYLTGGVWTKGKKSFTRGRMEIRAKLEGVQGAWPAIWMLPFDEEKYVYTGATVGGISMGGIHKTGGHYYKQNKTSKVQFVYYFYDPQKNNHLYNIKKIRLNNKELIEKAEKSSIRRYLKNDCIMIEEEISAEDLKKLKDSMVSAADAGNMNMARNINSYITTESLPTKEKCIAIINWLSTCD